MALEHVPNTLMVSRQETTTSDAIELTAAMDSPGPADGYNIWIEGHRYILQRNCRTSDFYLIDPARRARE